MRVGLLLAWLLLSACGAMQISSPLMAEDGMPVYIIDHGYHAGIAVRAADIPRGMIPERADFLGSDYLEFGWGDWDYYQSDDPGLWLTLKAALWPTRTVLHVVGLPGSPTDYFPGADSLELRLHARAFDRLAGFIHRSFRRQGGAKAWPLRKGYYPLSYFYPAHGRFHLFHNCNGWVAEALAQAGLALGWPRPVTADQLMARLRRLLARDLALQHRNRGKDKLPRVGTVG